MAPMKTVLAALILAARTASAEAPDRPQLRIGDPAPAFELQDVGGAQYNSESLKGKPAVLFFAATWCSYSNKLSKAVKAVHRRYQDKIRVVLIDIKEDQKKVSKTWVKKKKLSCPVLLDSDGAVARAYAPPPDFLPGASREDTITGTVLLLDAEGRIRHYPQPTTNPGEIDWDLAGLQATLDRILATPVPASGTAPGPP